jgi:hypothetical protein
LKAGSAKARAAGRKAARTRARNKRLGKTSRKPSRGGRTVKKSRRKGQIPQGFKKYKVNKAQLIAKLEAKKQTSFKPTEVVSITWDVIRGGPKKRKK